jgi:hypothetical protein
VAAADITQLEFVGQLNGVLANTLTGTNFV